MEEVSGFTQKQRQWFLQRDHNQCCFHWKENGKWVRCKERHNLQVHHIIPRGWARENMPLSFGVNTPENGITLCRKHHVGWKMGREFKECVHTDNETARISYTQGNKEAYRQMHNHRVDLCKTGRPYWNTRFDWMLNRICQKHNANFNKTFPQNGNRFANGRLRELRPAL